MSRRTFKVTQCDACDHQFRAHPPEKIYMMAFRPDGANFEIAYALCRKCYPQVPGNIELVEHVKARMAERCPEYVEHTRTYRLQRCDAEGAA